MRLYTSLALRVWRVRLTTDGSFTGTKCETALRATAVDAAIPGAAWFSIHSRALRSLRSGLSASPQTETMAENKRAGCGGHSLRRRSLYAVATYRPVRKLTSIANRSVVDTVQLPRGSVAATL